MATSEIEKSEFPLSKNMRACLEVWEDEVSIDKNTSKVYARIKVWRTNSWSGETYSTSVTKKIVINGITVYNVTEGISHYKSYGEITVAEGSTIVTHNSDGKKSITISCSLVDNIPDNYFNGSTSLNMDLTEIPRQANLEKADNFDDESNPTITYKNAAGNSVSELKAAIYSEDESTAFAAYRDVTKTGTSYTFSLTSTERKALRQAATSNTLTVRFILRTKIGSNTYYSKLDRTLTIINGEPTFSNFTYADVNSTTTAITGNSQYLIQGVSSLRATITAANKATANKEATMSKYVATINGQEASATYSSSASVNISVETVDATTDSTLSIAAVDSRGNKKSVDKTVKMLPYSAPVVVARGTRTNNFENNTTIHIEGSVSPLTIGSTNKNTVNATSGVQYRYREQGTSTWGSWTNRASTMGSNGVIGTTDFVLSLDNTKAYEFEAKITDELNTTTVSFVVSVGIPIFRIGTDGNCYNNEKRMLNTDDIPAVTHVGQVIMSTTLTTAAQVKAVYGGTWVAWGTGRVPVGIDSSDSDFKTVNATGGSKTVTLDVTQIPSHEHQVHVKRNTDYVPLIGSYGANGGTANPHIPWSVSNSSGSYYGTYATAVGGSQPHSNLSPFQVVYFWRRSV